LSPANRSFQDRTVGVTTKRAHSGFTSGDSIRLWMGRPNEENGALVS